MLSLSRVCGGLSALAALVGTACSNSSTPTGPDLPPALAVVDLDGVRYTATSRLSDTTPRQVVVTVTAENHTGDPIEIEVAANIDSPGACGAVSRLLVYRTPARSGQPTWDSFDMDAICPAIATAITLEPGAPREFTRLTDVRDILGDSIPNGRYYFTAALEFSVGPNHTDRTIVLAAGDLDLAR